MDAAMVIQQELLPVTAQEIRAQVNRIQEVMKAVMQEGIHYGKVPGCGDKPTLLKPGAEKILATFRICVTPDVDDLSTPDCCRYRVKAIGTTPNGVHVGTGIGECSSDEEKYKWRAATHDKEFNAVDESRKRTKYLRDGRELKQVRTNAADVANTVLKMAKKRAQVDLCLTATAASDIFTQDVEDLPEELRDEQQPQKPPIQQPARKSAAQSTAPAAATSSAPPAQQQAAPAKPAANPDTGELSLTIREVPSVGAPKTGTKKNGQPWKKWSYKSPAAQCWLGTFSESIGGLLEQATESGKPLDIVYESTQNGGDIIQAKWAE